MPTLACLKNVEIALNNALENEAIFDSSMLIDIWFIKATLIGKAPT